jgi:ligand-binding sensor domain-containing protein/signal transduction histidine kinase/DNA-binding response OmpR family regulator
MKPANFRYYLFFWYMIIFSLFIPALLSAQKSSIRFQHYTADQGLSQNMIDCILQDSKGFMWFGTWNGLNRFDGYSFTVFKQEPENKNTISNNFIYALCEDKFGNIWIGTGGGLNIFVHEADKFIEYKNKPGDHQKIISNRINAIISDRHGDIWIGTDKGADKIKIDNKSGDIKEVYHFISSNQPGDLSGNNVLTIYEDRNDNIWIGTDNGLNLYNRESNIFKVFQNQPQNPYTLAENTINTIYQDSQEFLWIGTNSGLSRMNLNSQVFTNYYHDPVNPASLVHNTVKSITEDLNKNLIIGTYGGMSIYNRKDDNFSNSVQQLNTSYGLNNDFINCVHADHKGNIWIGTERGGINKYNIYQKNFEFLEHESGNANSLSHKTVNSIWEDDDNIWIGTAGGGLNKFDKKSQNFRHFRYEAGNPNSLASDFITSIYRDKKSNLWIGSWGGGLHKLMPGRETSGIFINYQSEPQYIRSLINDFVSSITEDEHGNLWIGTLGGLDKFNPVTNKFEHFTGEHEYKRVDQVGCLHFDKWNNLWVGTIQGLFKIYADGNGIIDTRKSKVKYFVNDPEKKNSISGNYVISICADKNNNLWFGTYGNGLNKLIFDTLDKNNEEIFISYTETDGLSNNVVYGILEDESGNLWLSTDNGLSKFDPEKEEFRNYYVADGLQSNQFYWSACHINKYGKMYFGSMNGLNAFYPEKITDINNTPQIVITDFKIYNRSVEVGKKYNNRVILSKAITHTNDLIISYKSNEISFEFSALDYDQPDKIEYAYKMENFDNQWTYVNSTRRFASYTNLKGGDYTFVVNATNNFGKWGDNPLKIKITIIPPFWVTWWFKMIAALMLISAIITYNRYRTYTLKNQKKKLEKLVKERTNKIEEQKEELIIQANNLKESNLQLERRQKQIEGQKKQLENQNIEILEQRDKLIELNKKVQHINQQQLKFFTHISHEFRTPLTLIITPIEQLIKRFDESSLINTKLQLVYKNAQRLLHLINQLMEIRKVEKGKIELTTSRGNIVKFVQNIAQSFSELSVQRNIKFNIITDSEVIEIYFDRDKVENIVYNLLSNAFKYTPEKGHISIEIKTSTGDHVPHEEIPIIDKHSYKHTETKEYAEIRVSDSGPGIEHSHIKDIFRKFYRIHSHISHKIQGTGIGLFLTKELVKAHKGLLFVRSEPDKGSSFSVLLPMGSKYLTPDEIIKEKSFITEANKNVHIKLLTEHSKSKQAKSIKEYSNITENNDEKPLLLFIDDDDDLCSYACEYFSKSFNVVSAINGQEGFEKAYEFSPDLIISDIIMPEVDGLELCTRLKSDINTSHIPVILLTARSEVENYVEGFETGADDYIPKPFNIEVLEAKSKSLIENRRKLRKSFIRSLEFVPKDITTSHTDEQFLQRTLEIIENNITNPEFGVKKLAAEMCVSRSLLHKKLTAIVDLSANDFITLIKLKKSALLLLNSNLTISEIAFEAGFNDPKYFSRCFKKHFGKSPSDYLSEKIQAQ